eukprot:724758-Amphidinium_carterae.1
MLTTAPENGCSQRGEVVFATGRWTLLEYLAQGHLSALEGEPAPAAGDVQAGKVVQHGKLDASGCQHMITFQSYAELSCVQ